MQASPSLGEHGAPTGESRTEIEHGKGNGDKGGDGREIKCARSKGNVCEGVDRADNVETATTTRMTRAPEIMARPGPADAAVIPRSHRR